MENEHETAVPPAKLRVGVACNIKTDRSSDSQAEFDEPETVEAICGAIRDGGFEAFVMDAGRDFPSGVRSGRPDIVFNIAEGSTGRSREAQIPAILDYYGVPYVGSDAAALAVALDKELTKRLAGSIGVGTPPFFLIRNGMEARAPEGVRFPILVKPNAEGSSKGVSDVSVAADQGELAAIAARDGALYGDLLAESYIDGREFTVGILGNGAAAAAFEPMEIEYRALRGKYKVYSYEVKKNYRDYIGYECPAKLPAELNERMKEEALGIFRLLGCRDFARMDFRLSEDGELYFIEANPLPGLAPGYSDYPMLAGFNGVGYGELVRAVLGAALSRCGMEA